MKRKVLPCVFTVLVLTIIIKGTSLPLGMLIAGLSIAFAGDFYAVRNSLLQIRTRLDKQGLELGHVIPTTLVIFVWLIYAVVHFQIFIAMVHYFDLPPGSLKWVFPLTAFKALWLAYYLGNKLSPAKIEPGYSIYDVAFQIPWAIGGAIAWYNSNAGGYFEWSLLIYSLFLVAIILLPSICRLRIK